MADKKLKFVMCNDMVMAEVIKIEDMVGGIFIPETAIDKWRMEAVITAISPKIDPMFDDYKIGDRVIYFGGSHVFPLQIDEMKRIVFHRKYIVCKVVEND